MREGHCRRVRLGRVDPVDVSSAVLVTVLIDDVAGKPAAETRAAEKVNDERTCSRLFCLPASRPLRANGGRRAVFHRMQRRQYQRQQVIGEQHLIMNIDCQLRPTVWRGYASRRPELRHDRTPKASDRREARSESNDAFPHAISNASLLSHRRSRFAPCRGHAVVHHASRARTRQEVSSRGPREGARLRRPDSSW